MALKHSRCPECAKKNKDTSKDNLITYSDGHSHCFSCGYHTQARTRERIMAHQVKEIEQSMVLLPEDFTFEIPELPLAWVKKYLTTIQIKLNNIGYSEQRKMLIFPYYILNNDLTGWQGRYFGDDPNQPKWFSQGTLHEILYILGEEGIQLNTLVLVEDILSALKVAEIQTTLPLFGSHISTKLLTRLYKLGYNTLWIWLDPDKRKESIRYAMQAKIIGFEVRPIFSELDPKEYTTQQIQYMLD